jgi:hypothetical protein
MNKNELPSLKLCEVAVWLFSHRAQKRQGLGALRFVKNRGRIFSAFAFDQMLPCHRLVCTRMTTAGVSSMTALTFEHVLRGFDLHTS